MRNERGLEEKNMFQLNVLIAGFTVLFCSAAGAAVEQFGACQSAVSNDSGVCVRLADCEFILNILNDMEKRDNVRKSQCGYDNSQTDKLRTILVCCPNKHLKSGSAGDEHKPVEAGNLLPEVGKCGSYLGEKILSGNKTLIDEFPWMALIKYQRVENSKFGLLCGGSIINSRYILTAAHCVRSPDIPSLWQWHSVLLGEWKIDTDPDCEVDIRGIQDCAPPSVEMAIENVLAHPDYDFGSSSKVHDIALIRLADYISPSEYVKPICLPLSPELRNENFRDFVMDVAGWGATEKLPQSNVKLKTRVKVTDMQRCQRLYNTLAIPLNETYQLCAGGVEGVDTCRGDSGGPLMVTTRLNNHDVFFVVGIVSFGPKPCGLRDWPGVYVRVGQYIDWLRNNLQS